MDSITNLNPQQQAAVEHINGPMLILAGAGRLYDTPFSPYRIPNKNPDLYYHHHYNKTAAEKSTAVRKTAI